LRVIQEPSQVKQFHMKTYDKDTFQIQLPIIKLGCNWQAGTNTLAYFAGASVTTKKVLWHCLLAHSPYVGSLCVEKNIERMWIIYECVGSDLRMSYVGLPANQRATRDLFCKTFFVCNRMAHIRHQCRETTVLCCHRCRINIGIEKMNYI
jgi:hypothetical protein